MSKSNKHAKPSRRQALAGLATLGATTAVAACERKWSPPASDDFGRGRHKPHVPGAEAWATHEERWATTSCAQCGAGCGIRVRVVEGRAVRIEGNKDNPLNRGGVGPRGLSGLQVLYDPDRITGPRVRKGGVLKSASWEQALSIVTEALAALRARGTPDRLVVVSGRERGMMNDLLSRFCDAYGSANFSDGRPNRSAAIAQAMESAFGSFEIPAYDWAGAHYVLSLEAGLLEDSCQAVYFARVAAERRRGKNGVRSKLVHAGAAFDLSAHNADQWLRITPGTGGALALGICRELIVNGAYDRAAVGAQTSGFDAFATAVREYTPETVAQITGVAPTMVQRIADQLWNSRPSFVFVDDRSVAYSNGRDTALAAFALNTLLGAVEAPAGGMRIAAAAPVRQWPPIADDEIATAGRAVPRIDRAGTDAFPRARSVQENLVEAIEKQPPEIMLLYATNPAYARHQPDRWRKALAKIPLIVSFSPFSDETVEQLAHVVLPDHTYLERYEDASAAPGLTRAVIGVRKPVVAPLHDTRATGDVILDIASRLGKSVAASMPWSSFRDAIDARFLGLHDANRGSVRASSERDFLAKLYEAAVWSDSAAPPPKSVKFNLPTTWQQPDWRGDESAYPLRLVLYRALGHSDGSGANQAWLHQLRTRPGARPWQHVALIHPSSAGGLVDGAVVTIASEWGQVEMPIQFERRMVPGCVAISLGRGHTAYGRFAKGVGVNALVLAAPGPAPITGASVLCGTRVRVSSGGKNG